MNITEAQIMKLAEKLKIRDWDMGNDGFGGEYVITKSRRDAILEFDAEARADEARKACADVCQFCREGNTPEREEFYWLHGGDEICDAGAIHERLHREKAEKEKKG